MPAILVLLLDKGRKKQLHKNLNFCRNQTLRLGMTNGINMAQKLLIMVQKNLNNENCVNSKYFRHRSFTRFFFVHLLFLSYGAISLVRQRYSGRMFQMPPGNGVR